MMQSRSRKLRCGGVARRAALFASLVLLAGCTVQPLYQNNPSALEGATAPLTTVSVSDVNERVAQQVRNQLIFLLYQGREVSSAPTYSASIKAVPAVQNVFVTTAPDGTTNISAKRIKLTGTLTLSRIDDGTQIAAQTRTATASFDQTRQEFANLRAERDAKNRAARELAEQFRIVIATALAER